MKTTIAKTAMTTLHFEWTPEEIEAFLEEQVREYVRAHFTREEAAEARIGTRLGSVYEGGIEISATVEIRYEVESWP